MVYGTPEGSRADAREVRSRSLNDAVTLGIGAEGSSSREGSLPTRLREVYADRPRKVLFVAGAEGLRYSDVIRAVDIALGAGVVVVGLVPRQGEGTAR